MTVRYRLGVADFSQISYSVAGSIATLTLSRPEKLNAFTLTMMREMISAFDLADADDSVRAVIVTGDGRAFCAGADLSAGGAPFDHTRTEAHKAGRVPRDGGGVLLTQGIHTLDLMLSLAGPIVEVAGYVMTSAVHRMETEDLVCAAVRFASGAVGVIDATTAAYPGAPERIELIGTGGTASATVSGDGSEWNNSEDLLIAQGGTASLSIADQGKMTVGGMTRLGGNGTLSLDGGSLVTGSFDRTQGIVNFDDGLLHVEFPIDDADDALRDETDDARAARRAHDEAQTPALVEQHRRRHARQRAFAALDAIRDRLAVDLGHVVEVGELIVQDEAADHELAAERALHARRHRDGVAMAVDDREVARRRPLGRRARSVVPSRGRKRIAGLDRRHGLARVDQRRARAQVARVEQSRDRRRHERSTSLGEDALFQSTPKIDALTSREDGMESGREGCPGSWITPAATVTARLETSARNSRSKARPMGSSLSRPSCSAVIPSRLAACRDAHSPMPYSGPRHKSRLRTNSSKVLAVEGSVRASSAGK